MMVESAFRNTSLPPHFFIWGHAMCWATVGMQIRESFGSNWVLPRQAKKKNYRGKRDNGKCESIQQKTEQDRQKEEERSGTKSQ